MLYIDDFLLMGRTYEECLLNITVTKQILLDLGFIINSEKSVFVPCINIKYLGFFLILFLVENNVKLTIREFAKLIGSYCGLPRYQI